MVHRGQIQRPKTHKLEDYIVFNVFSAHRWIQVCFMLSALRSQMMDESEACSLPGGLASVKRQFESQEFASSSSQSSVTQFHFEQRSVQVSM